MMQSALKRVIFDTNNSLIKCCLTQQSASKYVTTQLFDCN